MKNLSYLFFAVFFVLIIVSCGSEKAEEEAAEKLAENLLENLTGGNIDIDINEDGETADITIEGIDGTDISIKSDGNEIPSDFPTDVFMVKGEVESAGTISSGEGEIFTVVILPEKKFKEIVSTLKKEMKSEGWTSAMNMNMGNEAMQMYTKGENSATITVTIEDKIIRVAYMVTVAK